LLTAWNSAKRETHLTNQTRQTLTHTITTQTAIGNRFPVSAGDRVIASSAVVVDVVVVGVVVVGVVGGTTLGGVVGCDGETVMLAACSIVDICCISNSRVFSTYLLMVSADGFTVVVVVGVVVVVVVVAVDGIVFDRKYTNAPSSNAPIMT
jgi:hypothetical protein